MSLTELIAIASHPSPSVSSEAYISLHSLHSSTQPQIFKKSATIAHGLAVSGSHVFAAQADKPVVNVYNRAKNSLETTVPLPEQVTAVTCSASGGVVAMGTSGGRVNIWETASGRFTSLPPSHLQKVTTLAFSPSSTFLLSGSLDTNIQVYSLPHITSSDPTTKKSPIRTLEYHQQAILSVLCGNGTGPSATAVSASQDSSVIVWNYIDGTLLRTFTLSAVPTCLALDPADRGFYVGYGDGSIQQVEFSKIGNRSVDLGANGTSEPKGEGERSYDSPLYRADEKHIPISASSTGAKWTAEGQKEAVTAMDVVFEGNYLVAGTEAGTVGVWDVATGHLFRTLTSYKAPISCVKVLPPTGFLESSPAGTTQATVVPPRYHDAVKASSGNAVDVDTSLPPLSLQFNSALPSLDGKDVTDAFSMASDADAIARGAAYFNSPAYNKEATGLDQIVVTENVKWVEDEGRIAELEKELAKEKERYRRLNEVHKKTWEEHTKWVMEVDKEKAEAMAAKGPEVDE